jgi:hypothetical protein
MVAARTMTGTGLTAMVPRMVVAVPDGGMVEDTIHAM